MTAVHPRLVAAFAALDEAAVPWALVRGADELAAPTGDVDLLVDRGALPRLDRVLADAGFVRMGQLGHGSHRFYFDLDPDDGTWIKLDVVTAVDFGPLQTLRTSLAPAVLARRRAEDGLRRLARDDEDWLFLLHLLLDKGEVAPRRQEAALRAAARASLDGPVATAVDRLTGEGAARAALGALRSGNPDAARREALALRRRWIRRAPVAAGARWLLGKAARTLDVPVTGGPEGVVVAIVGPDGAGKSTLSDGLRSRWPGSSRPVYMGLWQAGRWDPVLHRLPGGRLGQRTARAVRGSLSARWHRGRRRLVVLDRSPLDLRLPGARDDSLGGRITERVLTALAPEPDVVVVLDAPGTVMFARKGEHSAELLEERRQGYLALAAELPAALVVDATLPPAEVARRALVRTWQRVAGREPAGSPAR